MHIKIEEAEMMKQQIADIGEFAATEAATRILSVASVLDEKQLMLVVGLRASRSLFISFLLSAIEDGMSHASAEEYVRDTLDAINEKIAEFAKKSDA